MITDYHKIIIKDTLFVFLLVTKVNTTTQAGKSMMFAQNNEHFVQNILFRVLKIIREESIKLYEQKEKVTLKRKSKMLPNAEANENKCWFVEDNFWKSWNN